MTDMAYDPQVMGRLIAQMRSQLGLSQAGLADAVGLSLESLMSVEHGVLSTKEERDYDKVKAWFKSKGIEFADDFSGTTKPSV